MVLGDDSYAGAQANIFRLRQHVGYEDIVGGNRFPPCGMVLPNPSFTESQFVCPNNALYVLFKRLRPILFRRMQRHHKCTNLHNSPLIVQVFFRI
jgi:hypothetical protein